MKKVRIYELSKKLGVANKELIDYLKNNLKLEVKSHSSSLEDDVAQKVEAEFKSRAAGEEKPSSRPRAGDAGKKTVKTARPPEKKPQESEASRKKRKKTTSTQETPNGELRKKPNFVTGETATIKEKLKGTGSDTASRSSKLLTRTFPRPKDNFRGRKGRKGRGRFVSRAPEVTKKESIQKWLELPETITVGDLAQKLEMPANEIIKMLMKQGIMAGINQNLAFETAAAVGKKFGFKIEQEKIEEVRPEEVEDDEKLLSHRPPVVTVLGHVDHGKTSLLDAIRHTKVTESESGGITQNIGASTVTFDDRRIVFIDTPGHEAFTQMRARGASVTDIAVLVVAADDGVMPQTIEAINHAKAAQVPIIVAINKIDRPEANPERVKQQLTEFELIPEDWGGDTIMVPVSAITKAGIDELLEMILLVAEMQELKANPSRPAQGTIIESKLDKGLGPVATVIVLNGTLRVGDSVVVGNEWGRIRIMVNDKGKRIKKALPSFPAEIIGLSGAPEAGDYLQVMEDEKYAKAISEDRKLKQRTERMKTDARVTLEDLFDQMKLGEVKELRIILKADVNGVLEAVRHSITRLSNDQVRINIIHGGIGAISESDVMLATASNAIIIGFNVRPDPTTRRMAEQENVDIRLYRVIYHAIQDIKKAMTGLLEPEYQEVMLGRAEIRAIFKVSKVGVVAGCYVLEGKLKRNSKIRLLRDNVVVFEGKIDSLRRFKDDVKEVQGGFECGVMIERFPGLQPGDIIEAYTLQEIERTLEDEDVSPPSRFKQPVKGS